MLQNSYTIGVRDTVADQNTLITIRDMIDKAKSKVRAEHQNRGGMV